MKRFLATFLCLCLAGIMFCSTAFAIAQYKIKFTSKEGSGSMDEVYVQDGQMYTFPECTFAAPADKTFDHWEMSGVDGIFYKGEEVKIASNCDFGDGVIVVNA